MVEKVDWAEVLEEVGEGIKEAGQTLDEYRQIEYVQDPANKSKKTKSTVSTHTEVAGAPFDDGERLGAKFLVEEGERLLVIWAGDLPIVPSHGDEVDYDGKTGKKVLKLLSEVNPGQTPIVYIVKIVA